MWYVIILFSGIGFLILCISIVGVIKREEDKRRYADYEEAINTMRKYWEVEEPEDLLLTEAKAIIKENK